MIYLPLRKILLLLPFLFLSRLAIAEPVTMLLDSGDPANRVDIVIMGDGYSAADIASGKYATDAQLVIDGFFKDQPFLDYKNFFNVHRIDVTSVDSGISHPENKIKKDTALEIYYNCSNIPRAVCPTTAGVKNANAIIARSLKNNQSDIFIIIINDTQRAGTAYGKFAISSVDSTFIRTTLHEVGHSFGKLADEYVEAGRCTLPTVEPSQVNVTLATLRHSIKWNGGGPPKGWIEPTTPIPTTRNDGYFVIGLFEGGLLCTTGVYRPSFYSLMNNSSRAFDAVSSQALILRMYNFVDPIDSASPPSNSVLVDKQQTFTVTTPTIANGSNNYEFVWRKNGRLVQSGLNNSYTFIDDTQFAFPTFTLEVAVKDTTSMVRYDADSVTTGRKSWIVSPAQPVAPKAVLAASPSIVPSVLTRVTLNGSWSEGEGLTYQFDMGDGVVRNTGSIPYLDYFYQLPGTYTVTLTIWDRLNRTAVTTTTVQVL